MAVAEDQNGLEVMLAGILPGDKYRNISPFTLEVGGTRQCFTADWGFNGGRKVMVKADKIPESSNALVHVSRGCNTGNDIAALSRLDVDEAIINGVNPLVDYYNDGEVDVSVEPLFRDSSSLRKYVEENGPLEGKRANQLFEQVLRAEKFLLRHGLYHRDLSPNNVLVRGNGNLEVRVTDLANATDLSSVDSKFRPTAGARSISDPFIMQVFTGQEGKYDDQAEMYSVGKTLLYALTGRQFFEFDAESGVAVVAETGESLLNENGLIDVNKYGAALKRALKNVSWRYRSAIRGCLDADRGKRHKNIEDLMNDYKRFNPLFDTSAKLWSATLGTLFATMGIFTGVVGPDNMQRWEQEKQVAVQEASKYVVTADYAGNGDIINNLVSLEPTIYNRDPFMLLYEGKSNVKSLHLTSGQELRIMPYLHEMPRPEEAHLAMPGFEGKVYVEGFEGVDFFTDSIIINPNRYEMHGPRVPWVNLTIPENASDGYYTLAVEIYAQDNEVRPNHKDASDNMRFENPERMLARKRIPITIGNLEGSVNCGSFTIDHYTNRLGFRDMSKEEYEILGEGFSSELFLNNEFLHEYIPEGRSNYMSHQFSLPASKDVRESILHAVIKKDGVPIGYTAFPLETFLLGHMSDEYWWRGGLPGKDFSDKLIEARQKYLE